MAGETKKAGPVQADPTPEKKPEPKAPADPVPTEKKPPAPEEPPRPVDKGKTVYLKLSELHPFHTFGTYPFKVIGSQPRMKELTASIKEQGVFTLTTVRPEKDGNK